MPSEGQAQGENSRCDQVEHLIFPGLGVKVEAHSQELGKDEWQGKMFPETERELNAGHLIPGNKKGEI